MTFDEWLGLSKLPKIEARMLLQYVSEYTRVQLLTRGGEEMPDEIRQRADRLAQRRLNGEPVAYILGVREFYGRRFTVNPNVLIPRPETEHLVEAVLARLPENGRVWDLGTGSGAVAVTVALERPDAFVRASDISTPALETARKNAADLGARVEFAHGSWFDTDMPSERQWDIIVSNPPYIENGDKHLSQGDLRFEPQIALTDFSDGKLHPHLGARRARPFGGRRFFVVGTRFRSGRGGARRVGGEWFFGSGNPAGFYRFGQGYAGEVYEAFEIIVCKIGGFSVIGL